MEAVMNSNSTNIRKTDSINLRFYLVQPFLAGLFGFTLVLATLTATYFVTAEFFHIGYFLIDSTDLLISSLGFVLLFWHTLRKKFENK